MLKLLIADDNVSVQMSLGIIFKNKPGYAMLTASTGKETLEVIDKEKPDLVLLDIVLPDIDGWEIARRLKEKSSLAKIIFITGSVADEELAEKIKRSGARGFISKPFDALHLEDRIKEIVPEFYQS